QRNDQLRKIEVHPEYGPDTAEIPEDEPPIDATVSETRRERLRQAIIRHRNSTRPSLPKTPLNAEKIEALTELDHVVRVVPQIQLPGRIHFGDKSETISTFGLPANNSLMRDRLIAGDGFHTPHDRSVVLNEFLLYRWGIIDEADLAAAVGKKVRLDVHVWGVR